MSHIFKWTKDLFGGGSKEEEDLESLTYDELLKRASELEYENNQMDNKICKLNQENDLLSNSIINKNNENSVFAKFLLLMENNLLNKNNEAINSNSTIDLLKQYLYDKKMFFGIIEEEKAEYLIKDDKNKNLDWKNNKEVYHLSQEILQKNIKELCSNMFITKDNKRSEKIHKVISKEEDNKEKEKEPIIEQIKNNDIINKEDTHKKRRITEDRNFMKSDIDFIGKKKKENEVNVYEDFLLNEDDNDNEN